MTFLVSFSKNVPGCPNVPPSPNVLPDGVPKVPVVGLFSSTSVIGFLSSDVRVMVLIDIVCAWASLFYAHLSRVLCRSQSCLWSSQPPSFRREERGLSYYLTYRME